MLQQISHNLNTKVKNVFSFPQVYDIIMSVVMSHFKICVKLPCMSQITLGEYCIYRIYSFDVRMSYCSKVKLSMNSKHLRS